MGTGNAYMHSIVQDCDTGQPIFLRFLLRVFSSGSAAMIRPNQSFVSVRLANLRPSISMNGRPLESHRSTVRRLTFHSFAIWGMPRSSRGGEVNVLPVQLGVGDP